MWKVEKFLKCKDLVNFLKEAPSHMRGFLIDKGYLVFTNGHFLYFEQLNHFTDRIMTFINLEGKEEPEKAEAFPKWEWVIPKKEDEKFIVTIKPSGFWEFINFLKEFKQGEWIKFEKGFEKGFEEKQLVLILTKVKVKDFILTLDEPVEIGYIARRSFKNQDDKIEVYFNPAYLWLMIRLFDKDLEEIVFYNNHYAVLFRRPNAIANFLLMPMFIE